MLGLRPRRRLERDLHDGAQQRLVSLALTLRMAREKLESDPSEIGSILDRARIELDEALDELRDLARGIHPTVLVDRGTGLRGLADRLAAIEARLQVESEPGRGTTVTATIPCHGLPVHD
jgi:signal transduction histidine kinase